MSGGGCAGVVSVAPDVGAALTGLAAGGLASLCHTTAAMLNAPMMAMMIPTMKMNSMDMQ